MRRVNRIAINLLIVGFFLLYSGLSSFGGGRSRQADVTLPFRDVCGFFLWRGQRISGSFSSNVSIDLFITDKENYRLYVQNHTFMQLLLCKNVTNQTLDFEAPKSGQYFVIMEKVAGHERTVRYSCSFHSSGINLDLLQPGILVSMMGVGTVLMGLFWNSKQNVRIKTSN